MEKVGTYFDPYRGNGAFVSFRSPLILARLTICVRWRWHFYFIRPASKPHYSRLYIGPFEFEWSKRP